MTMSRKILEVRNLVKLTTFSFCRYFQDRWFGPFSGRCALWWWRRWGVSRKGPEGRHSEAEVVGSSGRQNITGIPAVSMQVSYWLAHFVFSWTSHLQIRLGFTNACKGTACLIAGGKNKPFVPCSFGLCVWVWSRLDSCRVWFLAVLGMRRFPNLLRHELILLWFMMYIFKCWIRTHAPCTYRCRIYYIYNYIYMYVYNIRLVSVGMESTQITNVMDIPRASCFFCLNE